MIERQTRKRGITTLTVTGWGSFRVFTMDRGWWRVRRTYVAHTGQIFWPPREMFSTWGGSHARAVRRLEAKVADWEHGVDVPAMVVDAPGVDAELVQAAYARAGWVWSCPDKACEFTMFGLVDHPFGDGMCVYHPEVRLVRLPTDA